MQHADVVDEGRQNRLQRLRVPFAIVLCQASDYPCHRQTVPCNVPRHVVRPDLRKEQRATLKCFILNRLGDRHQRFAFNAGVAGQGGQDLRQGVAQVRLVPAPFERPRDHRQPVGDEMEQCFQALAHAHLALGASGNACTLRTTASVMLAVSR